jgi:hypothetical protein
MPPSRTIGTICDHLPDPENGEATSAELEEVMRGVFSPLSQNPRFTVEIEIVPDPGREDRREQRIWELQAALTGTTLSYH